MNYFEIGFSKKKKKTLKAHGSMHLLSYGCVRTRIDIVILNPIDL